MVHHLLWKIKTASFPSLLITSAYCRDAVKHARHGSDLGHLYTWVNITKLAVTKPMHEWMCCHVYITIRVVSDELLTKFIHVVTLEAS